MKTFKTAIIDALDEYKQGPNVKKNMHHVVVHEGSTEGYVTESLLSYLKQ